MNDDVKTETFQRRALWPVVKALEAVSSDTPYTWAGWDQERYSYSLLATDTTMMLLCRDLLPEAAGAAKSLISLFQRQGMRKPFWEGGPAGVYVPAAKLRQALTACAKKPKDIMQVSVSRDEPAHATLQVVCSPPDSVGSESEVRWDYEATAYRQLTIDRVIASGIGRHRLPYELPDAADLLDLVALGLTPEGAVSLTHPRPSDSQYDYQRMSRGLSVMHKCKELSVVPGSGVSPQRPLMLTGRHPQLGVAEFYIQPFSVRPPRAS